MPKPKRLGVKPRATNPPESDFVGTVRDLAGDGRAVVEHTDGRVFFVAGAWLDENIRVRPTGKQRGAWVGELIAVIIPSASRKQPECQYQGVAKTDCGGCPWMLVDYAAQLKAKADRITRALGSLGADIARFKGVISASTPLGYRNRAQLKTDGSKVGYLAARSSHLVDVEECLVLNPACADKLVSLRDALPNSDWRRGTSRHRKASSPRQYTTLNIDDQIDDVLIDQRSPFRQGNSAQNARLRRWLAAILEQFPVDSPVLELFAGSGNLTALLAERFNNVSAVESEQRSVAALAQDFPGVSAQRADLFDERSVEQLVATCPDTQLLVVDPPRDGMKVRVPLINGLSQLEAVIYISCNVATWQRDCRDFLAAGFELAEVTGLDLFPQTPHIEILSVLLRP